MATPALAYQTDRGINYGLCGPATAGTEQSDTVYLTAANDVFDGRGGQDQIYGQGGDDCIFGGDGQDTVNGDDGNDVLVGGPGGDGLRDYFDGNDDIDATEGVGAPGVDSITAGPGDDDIKADDGLADTIDCGFGQDRVDADAADTVMANCEQRVDLFEAEAPSLVVGGSLEASAHEPLTGELYELEVEADDEISGARRIEVLVDGQQMALEEAECPGGGCGLELEWDFVRDQFAVGPHNIEVTATDWAGNEATHSFAVDLSATRTPDPTAADVTRINDGEAGDADRGGGGAGRCWDGTPPAVLRSSPETFQSRRLVNGDTRAVALLEDGTYWSSTCHPNGQLRRAQRVAPVDTPDGRHMLVVAFADPVPSRPDEIVIARLHYAPPSDPSFQRSWPAEKGRALAEVQPPTP